VLLLAMFRPEFQPPWTGHVNGPGRPRGTAPIWRVGIAYRNFRL
jgi:hypothetical protein